MLCSSKQFKAGAFPGKGAQVVLFISQADGSARRARRGQGVMRPRGGGCSFCPERCRRGGSCPGWAEDDMRREEWSGRQGRGGERRRRWLASSVRVDLLIYSFSCTLRKHLLRAHCLAGSVLNAGVSRMTPVQFLPSTRSQFGGGGRARIDMETNNYSLWNKWEVIIETA